MVILNSVHCISCHRPVSAGLLSYIYIYGWMGHRSVFIGLFSLLYYLLYYSATISYPLFQRLMLPGDEDDEEDEKLPSCMDYVMHFLTLFWKVIFACVPPTGKYTQIFNNLFSLPIIVEADIFFADLVLLFSLLV